MTKQSRDRDGDDSDDGGGVEPIPLLFLLLYNLLLLLLLLWLLLRWVFCRGFFAAHGGTSGLTVRSSGSRRTEHPETLVHSLKSRLLSLKVRGHKNTTLGCGNYTTVYLKILFALTTTVGLHRLEGPHKSACVYALRLHSDRKSCSLTLIAPVARSIPENADAYGLSNCNNKHTHAYTHAHTRTHSSPLLVVGRVIRRGYGLHDVVHGRWWRVVEHCTSGSASTRGCLVALRVVLPTWRHTQESSPCHTKIICRGESAFVLMAVFLNSWKLFWCEESFSDDAC